MRDSSAVFAFWEFSFILATESEKNGILEFCLLFDRRRPSVLAARRVTLASDLWDGGNWMRNDDDGDAAGDVDDLLVSCPMQWKNDRNQTAMK